MTKLFCSKASHNPYKEEMITEIPERVFQIDGYSVADRLLEGVPFDVYFDDNGVSEVKISDDYYRNYFENNFNSKRWYDEVKKYADRILEDFSISNQRYDEVDVPKFIKDKYFKNGINLAFITNAEV